MSGELWADYRRTWENFSRKLREMQELADSGTSAAETLNTKLAEVELARLRHNESRDRLAKYLVSQKMQSTEMRNGSGAREKERNIRITARLIWEFSGKPQNSAESDWLKAEKLVHKASA